MIVWDLKTLKPQCVIRDPNVSTDANNRIEVGHVVFTPDSQSLVVCIASHEVGWGKDKNQSCELAATWNLATGKRQTAYSWPLEYAPVVWVAAQGKEIATVSKKSARFFTANEGKQLIEMPVPVSLFGPTCVAAGVDRFATCSIESGQPKVHVVDARLGKELHSFPIVAPDQGKHGMPSEKVRLALSTDGNLIIAADEAGTIHVHDVGARKETAKFEHPAGKGIGPMKLSANAKTLYLGGLDGALYRWDIVNNRQLPDIGKHLMRRLNDIAISADESMLYSVGEDSIVHRWDLKAGKMLTDPDGYSDQTFTALTPDGRHVFVADVAGRLDLWDVGAGRLARRIQAAGPALAGGLAISSDGRRLACGRNMSEVQLWDVAAGKVEKTFVLTEKPDPTKPDPVGQVSFGPGDRVLYAGTKGTGATAWEVATGKKLWAAPGLGMLVAADPRGRWVAVGGGRDQAPQWSDHFRLLDVATGAVVQTYAVDRFRDGPPSGTIFVAFLTAMTFTPDGSRLLTAHVDGTVRVWDPVSEKQVAMLYRPGTGNLSTYLGGLAVSRDGKWLAVAAEDFAIDLWDLAASKRAHTIRGHDSLAYSMAFTRDGRGLIGDADLSPVLWSLKPTNLPADDGSGDALWQGLAAEDAAKAYRCQWTLIANPKLAIGIFADRMKLADLVTARVRFDKLVADLDNPQFRIREAAEKELRQADTRVPVAWLRKATAESKLEETRTRLERILALHKPPGPAEWRHARAIQVLELIGTDEAKALLKTWSVGDSSPVVDDARGALERLAARA